MFPGEGRGPVTGRIW